MTLGDQNRGRLTTEGVGEFRCPICRARCTESQSSDVPGEFGHYPGCPERPDHLPNGGSHYFKPDEEDIGRVAADGGEEVDP
ncbi:hypothetical protein [Halorarum salinum]|uniref:Uncharacterized protein n=1 Tax=Halorarum salinum TaxID=2743089 RepID=A0A7D5LAV1_9EURY|nr:hypothetical protein [Halobaculum salinum]QLG62188.1 hypothetical protein HUG12_10765 [Halobaculum salinum]